MAAEPEQPTVETLADSQKSSPQMPAPKTPAKVVAKKAVEPKEERKQPLPYRLEATGMVCAYSAEMIIHEADHLDVWFKDFQRRRLNRCQCLEKKPRDRQIR